MKHCEYGPYYLKGAKTVLEPDLIYHRPEMPDGFFERPLRQDVAPVGLHDVDIRGVNVVSWTIFELERGVEPDPGPML
jgi:hypothetical protein